jgi:hypothetical protein
VFGYKPSLNWHNIHINNDAECFNILQAATDIVIHSIQNLGVCPAYPVVIGFTSFGSVFNSRTIGWVKHVIKSEGVRNNIFLLDCGFSYCSGGRGHLAVMNCLKYSIIVSKNSFNKSVSQEYLILVFRKMKLQAEEYFTAIFVSLRNILWAGRPGFDSRQFKIFLFSTASRPVVGPTHSPIQWILGAVSPGVKGQGREADHSPPSSAEVKIGGAIPPLPQIYSWHNA